MPTASIAMSDADRQATEADEAELAELKDMWNSREISAREYREMRRTVVERINERMNAVLRFLFAAVIIDEHRAPPGKPDYNRIEIEPNPRMESLLRLFLTYR